MLNCAIVITMFVKDRILSYNHSGLHYYRCLLVTMILNCAIVTTVCEGQNSVIQSLWITLFQIFTDDNDLEPCHCNYYVCEGQNSVIQSLWITLFQIFTDDNDLEPCHCNYYVCEGQNSVIQSLWITLLQMFTDDNYFFLLEEKRIFPFVCDSFW